MELTLTQEKAKQDLDLIAKLSVFALELQRQTNKRLAADWWKTGKVLPDCFRAQSKIIPGKKYTKIDIGGSGRYMVVNGSGEIFGIKAYGVIHRGHQYGTLDTINDWNWSEYKAFRRAK